jgi:hypothetical protein
MPSAAMTRSKLDIGHRSLAVEHFHGHVRECAAPRIDVGHAQLVELVLADPRHQAHPLGHLAARAPQIHRLPAGPGSGGPLDDGDPDIGPEQLQRNGIAGDAAAGNEDVEGVGSGAHGVRPIG